MDLGHVTGIPVLSRTSARPGERRRSLRYRCSGFAEVLRIPRIGVSVRATLSDLSLHGCLILTDICFESGVPLEVLLQVKALSFRASGMVKVVHRPAAIGIEFTRISDGAQRRLAELLADLDRFVALPARKVQPVPVIEYQPENVKNLPVSTRPMRNSEPIELELPLRSPDVHAAQPAAQLRPQRLLLRRPPEVDVFG